MGKLFRFLDDNIVKIGISFLLLFTTLYPKLPSVHIIRTYVYIRLEDFFIAAIVIIWLIQLIRRKVKLAPFLLSLPIYVYWLVGLLCLIVSLLVFGPQTLNFFPHLAALEYLRRIEYMILFFVAFSTVKNKKDIRDYFIVLCAAILLISLYGIGQKFYGFLWVNFPYLKQLNLCFPSFQTGNEEFAKGAALCLPADGRITSTFGGSYDLAAYMVFIIPILITVLLTIKKWSLRIGLFLLSILSLMMLIFTASRVSFISYVVGIIAALIFFKKKIFLIPVLLISLLLLFVFSSSTIKRFEQTIRFTSIITNQQGQVVGEVSSTTNTGGKKVIKGNIPSQALPVGSVVIGFPTRSIATTSATIQQDLSPEQARSLRFQNGGYQLSTVNGAFLIQKALALDISFTTRFQAEWPRAWEAFLKDPWLGTGYSTLTLATDGDYLRFLGESGLLGTISFFAIFFFLGIALYEIYPHVTSKFDKAIFMGVGGGMVGIFVNAIFIDVFEASKDAENIWMILGITTAALLLYQKRPIAYFLRFRQLLTSPVFCSIYLLIILLAAFVSSINNFFVADDFTWLHWVANSTFSDIPKFFTDSSGFFYRPFDKSIMFFLYSLFSFNPQGYHLFSLFLHYVASVGVFFLSRKVLNKNLLAFFAAVLFLLLPSQSENIYWISTLSTTLSTVFILYGLLCSFHYFEKKSVFWYSVALLFGILAFFSYELAMVYPLLITLVLFYVEEFRPKLNQLWSLFPFYLLIPFYFIIRQVTHAFSGGGDYSYNIVHFIPNMFGNWIGYAGLFIFGESFFSIYEPLRSSLRSEATLILILLLLFVLVVITILVIYRSNVKHWLLHKNARIIIFAILFAMIAPLPFLGLGNISERYSYLASVGFVILVVFILEQLIMVSPMHKKYKVPLLFGIITVVCILYVMQQNSVASEWNYAGSITKDTMTAFRLDYSNLNKSANVYLVNLPIKYKNAWVYPVGVNDSMWFIYRDNMPNFVYPTSLDLAKQEANYSYNNKHSNNYIFSFDKNEYIYKIK